MNLSTSLTLNANRHPDKIAVICEGRSYTYKELNDEVNRMANGFLQLGYKKGDKVGMFMKNSDHFIITFYALAKAGLVIVPVNFRLTATETSYILAQSDCIAVICDAEYEEIISEASKNETDVKHTIVHPQASESENLNWDEVRSNNVQEPPVEVVATDDAEILYTSGTTGQPKGALFDHQRIVNVNTAFIMGTEINQHDRLIHLAPLFHSAQLNLFFLTGIMVGTTNIIHRDFNPVEVLKAIEEYKITYFFGVPAMYNALLQVPEREKYNLSTVQKCLYGAAPMAPGLIDQAIELFGTDQFYNLCGLTEAGPGGVILYPDEHKTKLGAGGKAMFLTNVRVVNDNMEDVQSGETGEFIIRGGTVMKEYYKKPEETSQALKGGWLFTGDLATIDAEGYITIVDRKKDMIISGGENVYSVEVEQVLNSHPKILEAATIGFPDERWGEAVGAVLVLKEGETVNEDEIITFCRERLAGYKIPRKFVYIDQLPRNTSGKILKYQLRETYQNEILQGLEGT
ncbi:class I adenylate-forming enzyme family protein [Sporosarcina pasteurii]|uniref:Long-chain-fatty-acid--CoA ligase n=2 Tax=Sporosarcina pasteurii TaxID=1474 RepID=A0A380C6N9_SPOPA|nr:long-chain fatty acid--CoA ligase [Sporosarcina pasteurii]QBQ04587.1 long-chain-fatty-acid--CoA ligase [Sporosarcina pasteurii]SUJ13974.1 Long-chain-fatty-acid--CoA ligase [Sporosarcina pasteurii]